MFLTRTLSEQSNFKPTSFHFIPPAGGDDDADDDERNYKTKI